MVDRLNAGVVMILMHLTIDGRVMTMMLVGGHSLMGNSWSDLLMYGSVMLAVAQEVLIEICRSLFHAEFKKKIRTDQASRTGEDSLARKREREK